MKKTITFNTEMVKAILDGRKTQFRITITEKIKYGTTGFEEYKTKLTEKSLDGLFGGHFGYGINGKRTNQFLKPKYKTGDILYVKEKCVDEYPNGFCFKEDYEEEEWNDKYLIKQYCNKLNARIFLKVTNVRVERLQDIKYSDIEKELGVNADNYKQYTSWSDLMACDFKDTWNSTAKDGYKWEYNPYVFVYEFERIEKQ